MSATTGRLARQTLRAAALVLALLPVLAAAGNAAPPAKPAETAADTSSQSPRSGGQDAPPAAQTPPAAQPAPQVAQLAPVVVVASRLPESLSDLSPSVSHIGADQLSAAGNHTLTDALRTQPGFFDLRDSVGQVASVFTRGTNSNMTLFTLDGRRLNPGFNNFDTGLLSTDNLSSVQIMRGASSTFYGANAAGGIIDLRSADPLAAEKPAGSVSGEAGSHGYWRGAFEYAASSKIENAGKAGVSLGGSWTEADGKRPNSQYRTSSLLPRADWRLNDNVTLNIVARHTDFEYALPDDENNPYATLRDRARGNNTLVSPGVKIKINDDAELEAFYAFSRGDYTADYWDDYAATPAYSPDHNIADGHEATARLAWRLGSLLSVGGGFTYEERVFDRDSAYVNYHGSISSVSPWLQVRLSPFKDFQLSAAGRYNHFSDYKDAWTGEFNASHRLALTGAVFHARIANAFSTPDIGNLAYSGSNGAILKPEKNLAWEIGLKQPLPFLSGGSLGAVLFQNRLSDVIQWSNADRTGYNLEKARAEGVELSGEFRPNAQLRFFANATFLRAVAKSDYPGKYTSGDRLQRRPDFSGTLGVEHAPTENITVGFSVTYVHGLEDFQYDYTAWANKRVDLKDYYYGRLYANFRVWERMEIFGRVENLFNETYSPSAGYPALPVTAYAGVRFRF